MCGIEITRIVFISRGRGHYELEDAADIGVARTVEVMLGDRVDLCVSHVLLPDARYEFIGERCDAGLGVRDQPGPRPRIRCARTRCARTRCARGHILRTRRAGGTVRRTTVIHLRSLEPIACMGLRSDRSTSIALDRHGPL